MTIGRQTNLINEGYVKKRGFGLSCKAGMLNLTLSLHAVAVLLSDLVSLHRSGYACGY